jgi:hypothetical protein
VRRVIFIRIFNALWYWCIGYRYGDANGWQYLLEAMRAFQLRPRRKCSWSHHNNSPKIPRVASETCHRPLLIRTFKPRD